MDTFQKSKFDLDSELQKLRSENVEFKHQLSQMKLTNVSFEGNDKKVPYMTGLTSFMTLITLFSIVEAHLSEGAMSSLSKFQKFLLVFIKLRLNTPVQDWVYRFGVSKSTISRTFTSTIHHFRQSFALKVAVIIDCFEICNERGSCSNLVPI